MPLQISPFGNDQFFDANGELAIGYKLFTYLADTSQKEAVFTDINGEAHHTNPIILNAYGMPPSPIFLLTNLQYKFVFTSADDTDPPAAPIYTCNGVDVGFAISGVPAVEWILADVPTYVSTTSFTVPGNQTLVFHVGRRVQCLSNLGTIYGTISATVFGAATTVTIVPDAGILDVTLSSVYYSFLSALGSSWPSGFNTGLLTSLNGGLYVPPTSNFNLLPVGMVAPFAGANLPAGYLWCNGQAISRSIYSSLFGAIGTVFGVGDNSTTFNVPDIRGRFPLGKDNMGGSAASRVTSASLGGADSIVLGGDGGEETHQLVIAEMPAHDHTLTVGTTTGGAQNGLNKEAFNSIVSTNDFIANTGSGAVHNTMPPWVAFNYIIRYA